MGNPAELPPTPAELLENETAKPPLAKGLKSFIGLPFRRPVLKPPFVTHTSSAPKTGVLLSGEVEKWTNYFGQWKPRCFEIVPGALLVFDTGRDNHRDQIPLMTCTIKSTRQVEVIVTRTDGAPLKLRFVSNRARSRWLSAIAKAKQMVCSGPVGFFLPLGGEDQAVDDACGARTPEAHLDQSSHISSSALHGSASPSRVPPSAENNAFTPPEEAVAITRLVDSLSRARAEYYKAREEIEVISRRLLEHLREAPLPARELATSMLIEQEHIDTIIQKHFSECNAAILQEQKERADLQQCLRREARENYKLGHKLQRVPRAGHGVTTRNSISRRGSGEEFYDFDDSQSLPTSSSEDEESAVASAMLTTSAGGSTSTPEEATVEPTGESVLVAAGSVKFRTRLPKQRTEIKTSLWSLLKDFVGKDLSRIALPVTFNEPTSFLQRLAEDYQYSNLLEKAGESSDDALRLLYALAFTITPWQSAIGRTYKPFNPLLGETYELTHRGYQFMAEQVGHHPPLTAYHNQGKNFEAYGHIAVDTKFTGKSLEVQLLGPTTIRIRNPATNRFELFSYRRPRMVVNNIIFGRISIEVAGTYTITNHTSGYYGVVEYPKSGWWGDMVQHPIRACIYDADGAPQYLVQGQWSKYLAAYKVSPSAGCVESNGASSGGTLYGSRLMKRNDCVVVGPQTAIDQEELRYPPKDIDFVPPWKELEKASGDGDEEGRILVWSAEPRPVYSPLYYSFGQMTFELNDLNAEYYHVRPKSATGAEEEAADGRVWLPRTDSRFRPDQKALEEGDVERSNSEKKRLEDKQRAAARLRGGGEVGYKPRWFERCSDRVTGEPTWRFKSEYWERQFTDLPDIL